MICDDFKCPNKSCEKRHPGTYRFFYEQKYCKFGKYYYFWHEYPLLEKIKSLDITLPEKESKIELLEEEIQEFKKKQIEVNNMEEDDCQGNDEEKNVMNGKNNDDFIESRKKIGIHNEENHSKDDLLACYWCSFEMKSTGGLKIHIKRMHRTTSNLCKLYSDFEVSEDVLLNQNGILSYYYCETSYKSSNDI